MNTTTKATRIGIATAIAAITFAVAACGTEDGTAPDKTEPQSVKTAQPHGHPKTSADAAERAERERAERAERADALRWAHGETTHRGHP
jgi:hypothetical protein